LFRAGCDSYDSHFSKGDSLSHQEQFYQKEQIPPIQNRRVQTPQLDYHEQSNTVVRACNFAALSIPSNATEKSFLGSKPRCIHRHFSVNHIKESKVYKSFVRAVHLHIRV